MPQPRLPASRGEPIRAMDMQPQDWDLLFTAVTQTLTESALRLPATAARATVEECARTLGLLRQSRFAALGEVSLLKAQLEAANSALSLARGDLIATQASELDAQQLAMLDSLTELPNRRHFYRRANDVLGMQVGAAPTLSILFVDLDDFKPVNDQHGHEVGDQLLRAVAQRLRDCMDKSDMVCRLGGDEFACLMPRPLARTDLCGLAGRISKAVSSPLKIGPLQFHVHASIGIAMFPDDGQTTAALLQRADSAMYRAKRMQLGYAFASDTTPAAARGASLS